VSRIRALHPSDVPFLPIEQIESEAEFLLQEYAERFEVTCEAPVPLDDIVELHLSLTLEFQDLKKSFPFADVHGAIWFDQGKIAIDSSLDPHKTRAMLGRYRFTLAHEVGHWQLHRQHYLQNPAERRLFEDGTVRPDVVCRSTQKKKPVEWQADQFAANLLMPRKLVFAAWTEFRGGDDGPVEIRETYPPCDNKPLMYGGKPAANAQQRDRAAMEDFCRPLAERFEVSAEAMRIRLETLNLFVKERPQMLF
jgi:hypothetical protein